MRVNVEALRQQAWRAAKLYDEFIAYAKQIGCTVVHDEEIVSDDEQARLLANWWQEHTTS